MRKLSKPLRPGELTDDQKAELEKPGYFELDTRLTVKEKGDQAKLSIDFFGYEVTCGQRVELDGLLARKARLRPDFVEYKTAKGKEVVKPPSYIYPKSVQVSLNGGLKTVDGVKVNPKKLSSKKVEEESLQDISNDNDDDFKDL